MLSIKNKHPRDKRIRFVEKSHTYFVDGSCEGYISSTTLVHSLFEKFDADKVIEKMKKSPKWIHSPYFGMTSDCIKNKWEENRNYAASEGTKMHQNIEYFYNNEDYEDKSKEFNLFKDFRTEHKTLIPYRTEWIIFDEISKVSGSIDMVYKDPDDQSKLIIADWKRSKEIKMENKWKKGKHISVEHLDDCNFIHYSLQLSIYKYILETCYNMKVSECFLVILHPNQETYLKYNIMDLDKEVKEILDDRKKKHNVKSIKENDQCSFKREFLKF